MAFAIPPLNDIDVFTNDCGFIAIVEEGRLAGYNLIAGGGHGHEPRQRQTYPRLADVIGFIGPEEVIETVKAVVRHPSGFWRPHQPETCAAQIRHRRTWRAVVPRRNWNGGAA